MTETEFFKTTIFRVSYRRHRSPTDGEFEQRQIVVDVVPIAKSRWWTSPCGTKSSTHTSQSCKASFRWDSPVWGFLFWSNRVQGTGDSKATPQSLLKMTLCGKRKPVNRFVFRVSRRGIWWREWFTVHPSGAIAFGQVWEFILSDTVRASTKSLHREWVSTAVLHRARPRGDLCTALIFTGKKHCKIEMGIVCAIMNVSILGEMESVRSKAVGSLWRLRF